MSHIVLNSYLRSSISLSKLARTQSDSFEQKQISGRIHKSDKHSVYAHAFENRAENEISELNYKFQQLDKFSGANLAAEKGISEMISLVDRAMTLEQQIEAETDIEIINHLEKQIDSLKEQALHMAETASYRGINLLNNSSGQNNPELATANIGDLFSADKSNNENEESSSLYNQPQEIALSSSTVTVKAGFSIDQLEDDQAVLFGNGQLVELHGDARVTDGPYGMNVVELEYNGNGRDNGGNYISMSSMDVPASFSMGIWARLDSKLSWGRIFDFSNNGDISDSINLTRSGTDDSLGFAYRTTGWRGITSTAGSVDLNEWAYWMVSLDDNGDASLYKNGSIVAIGNLGIQPEAKTRTDLFIGASYVGGDPTVAGAFGDFTLLDGALDHTQADEWYNEVASAGHLSDQMILQEPEEAEELSLEEIKQELENWQGVFAQETYMYDMEMDYISKKIGFLHSDVSNHIQIDDNENAIALQSAQLRSSLAINSVSIAMNIHQNILSIF